MLRARSSTTPTPRGPTTASEASTACSTWSSASASRRGSIDREPLLREARRRGRSRGRRRAGAARAARGASRRARSRRPLARRTPGSRRGGVPARARTVERARGPRTQSLARDGKTRSGSSA
jgi:hypothetical protein